MGFRSVFVVTLVLAVITSRGQQSIQEALQNPEYVSELSVWNAEDIALLNKNVAKFKNLSSLAVSLAGCKTFPKAIGKLSSLQILKIYCYGSTDYDGSDISKCYIKSLPNEILQLTQLEVLHVYSSDIQAIPSDINKLVNLRVLQASGLKYLPTNITKCQNLEQLDLNGSPLKTIPAGLFEMPSLRELRINCSSLATLPQTISGCKNLKRLELGGSATEIPKDIAELSLISLTLNLPLYSFPDVVFNCRNLEHLQIDNISPGIVITDRFSSLVHLKTLILSGKYIEGVVTHRDLPKTMFDLPMIETLRVAGLGVDRIDSRIRQLARLKMLFLDNNNITTVGSDLGQLKQLEHLDLSSNPLKSLPLEIPRIPSLSSIDLNDTKVITFSREFLDLLKQRRNISFSILRTPFAEWIMQSDDGYGFLESLGQYGISFEYYESEGE